MFRLSLVAAALTAAPLTAAPLTVTVRPPTRELNATLVQGTARDPAGHVLTVDRAGLRRDGEAWLPAMGEFHYTRYPADEWREELLKMKAGGISIVSTYVFWIHHEEAPGEWDWSGSRDLRRFVETVRDVGLEVIVRCGPWCHGEVRNGGLPDWVVAHTDWKLRSTDSAFLGATRELYAQIATQLHGLLWRDGGPVIGIQLDNEYRGPAAYLLALKELARSVGLDVPLYTRTGWPELATPMPFGEILPLYGAYAEGFWDRELTAMPGRYWAAFQFSTLRTDAAIATEMLGRRVARDEADTARYPYFTCEIGGGMASSYHRRIRLDPRDVEATTLVKLGSGSTLPGYYMYQGGTNPDGRRTTLMEAQDTALTNYNDLPVKTYDFQAPLGEFGEVRPQYHWLRRLHLFLAEDGPELAGMPAVLPDERPAGPDDVTTLRWAVRSDGRRGFVFLSNYERGRTLPAKRDVQFAIALAGGATLTFPSVPVTIPESALAWWPFNLNLGGVVLTYATALPVTHVIDASGLRTVVFAATPGVPAEFAFPAADVVRIESRGRVTTAAGRVLVRDVPTGRGVALRVATKSGPGVQIVLLDEADSLRLWKGSLAGRARLVLSDATLVFDRQAIRATPVRPGSTDVAFCPAPAELRIGESHPGHGVREGVFMRYPLPDGCTERPVEFSLVQKAGPLREIPRGPGKSGVAMAPKTADFAAAAVWSLRLPATDPARHPLLRLTYVGDVARVEVGGRLITDDFYNGAPREVGLWRLGTKEARQPIDVAILPLQAHAPIFLAASARPDFRGAPAVARLEHAELIEAPTFLLTGRPEPEPPLPANFQTDRAFPPTPFGR